MCYILEDSLDVVGRKKDFPGMGGENYWHAHSYVVSKILPWPKTLQMTSIENMFDKIIILFAYQ